MKETLKKKVLIVGASSKLGLHLSKSLIREKIEVGVHYNLNKNNLLELKKKSKNKFELFKLDLLNLSRIKLMFKKFYKEFNGITDLVYCPTYPIKKRKLFIDFTDDEIVNMAYINYLAAMICFRESLKLMKLDNKKKSIIYISSYATKTGGKNISHYASSKSAIEILFKSIKKENKDSNISFKVLKPSNIFYDKNEKINKFSSDADLIVESIKNIIFKNIQ